MAVELIRRRFTVDEYYAMARAGILGEDDRVELIDGEVVEMPPIGPEHSGAVDGVARLFFRTFDDVAGVRIQNPIRLSQYNEPEPDVALVRPRERGYRTEHPQPADVFLVVEVADSSLRVDQHVKAPLYASANIPELWLIDIPHDVVHVSREPVAGGYRLTRTARRGESLAPLAFPDREVAVDDLLG